MAIISSEDIESVQGALMTLEDLSKERAFLWKPLVDHLLHQRGEITAEMFYRLRWPETKNRESSLPDFRNSLKKNAIELNRLLKALVGYGYDVEVRWKDNSYYFLHVAKLEKWPASQRWFDHEFMWGPKTNRKALPVWVPVHGDGEEIYIKLHPEEHPWVAPPGYRGYEEFRKTHWPKSAERHKIPPYSQGWCVRRFLPFPAKSGTRGIELRLVPVSFPDIFSTTLHLDIPELPGAGADRGEKTIRTWLNNHTDDCHAAGLTHFIPAANPLTVDVNVITRDNYFLFRWYEQPRLPGDETDPVKRWEPAIFGYVDSLEDVYRSDLNIPDPSNTVFRRSCHLLGIPIMPSRISWLGVGFGLEFGRVSLFGKVRINESADEVMSKLPASQFKLVGPTADAVHRALYAENHEKGSANHRPHFKVLLALSLAGPRRQDAKVETSTRPSPELIKVLDTPLSELRTKYA